jgi:hypothetical protein
MSYSEESKEKVFQRLAEMRFGDVVWEESHIANTNSFYLFE